MNTRGVNRFRVTKRENVPEVLSIDRFLLWWTSMNFTVDEDRLLFSLAIKQIAQKGRINWGQLWLGMPYAGKTKCQLKTRLKTLKRTYGSDLKKFPPCFFPQSHQSLRSTSVGGNNCGEKFGAIDMSCTGDNTITEDDAVSENDARSHNVVESSSINTETYSCQSPITALHTHGLYLGDDDSGFGTSDAASTIDTSECLDVASEFNFCTDFVDMLRDGTIDEQGSSDFAHQQICDDHAIAITSILTPNCSESVDCQSSANAQSAVAHIFSGVSIHELRAPSSSFDFHYGEIKPASVSAILAGIPRLQKSDTFVDIGSGVGNVVAQIALETHVGHCIGIEFQPKVAEVSRTRIREAQKSFPRLADIQIYEEDIRRLGQSAKDDLQSTTILFTNNLRFAPSTNEALERVVMEAQCLRHVIMMDKLCCRHQHRCSRAFCSSWIQSASFTVQVSWSDRDHVAYLYRKRD